MEQTKPWNKKMENCFDASFKMQFKNWYDASKQKSRFKSPSVIELNEIKLELTNVYNSGYGFKVMSRSLNISYTKLRTIFKFLEIEYRHGKNIITQPMKEFRSTRVKGCCNPWSDTECRKNVHSNGIQGLYKTKSNDEIWLRSCWEYIYAKWMDKNNINWKYEEKQYKLSDGTSYRPDFFIYDNSNVITHIVEVKGFLKDKLYKTKLLENEYNISVVILDNIEYYCEKNYETELKLWKLLQKR